MRMGEDLRAALLAHVRCGMSAPTQSVLAMRWLYHGPRQPAEIVSYLCPVPRDFGLGLWCTFDAWAFVSSLCRDPRWPYDAECRPTPSPQCTTTRSSRSG